MNVECLLRDSMKTKPKSNRGARQKTSTPKNVTRMNYNENPYGMSDEVKKAVTDASLNSYMYQDFYAVDLKKQLADLYGLTVDHVCIGAGSSAIIDMLGEVFINYGDEVVYCAPTYEAFPDMVSDNGGVRVVLPLTDDYCYDLDAMLAAITDKTKMVIVCNPNNPTSSCITSTDMRRILDACKEYDIYVMVDETYVEFAENMEEIDSVPLTNYYNNIVILRGTSKFFAAPGLRLGYAITGNRDLIKSINTRKNPWTINSLAVVAGETMFSDTAYIKETKDLITKERARMYQAFCESPDYKVYKPSGNFMLVRILRNDLTSQELFDRAIREKMMIRDCSTFPFLDNKYIRFCIMNPEDNDRLLHCLLNNE